MKIAQVAPLVEAVPPRLYGGTERVVSFLTEELVAQGHEVVLFASGDSRTSARLVAGCESGLRFRGETDYAARHRDMLDRLCMRADDFDIIHCHIDVHRHDLHRAAGGKLVSTIHSGLNPVAYDVTLDEGAFVSISYAQRKSLLHPSRWLANVYHGLPAHVCPFSTAGGKYLAFLGRICPEKGLGRAIEVAKRSGLPLKIAAKVDSVDRLYFRDEIEPLLDHPLIDFVGEIDEAQKSVFLGGASALLFPIDWQEPFGLVQIEAMSAGTPVVAWRNGSVPEIVQHGISGYVVESIDEAVDAISRVAGLSRQGVRLCFESRFTARAMAASYVEAYRTLLDRRGIGTQVPAETNA